MPDINNLGNLLSLKQQLPRFEIDGVLTQFWHSLVAADGDAMVTAVHYTADDRCDGKHSRNFLR
jgi:hypothetical protein